MIHCFTVNIKHIKIHELILFWRFRVALPLNFFFFYLQQTIRALCLLYQNTIRYDFVHPNNAIAIFHAFSLSSFAAQRNNHDFIAHQYFVFFSSSIFSKLIMVRTEPNQTEFFFDFNAFYGYILVICSIIERLIGNHVFGLICFEHCNRLRPQKRSADYLKSAISCSTTDNNPKRYDKNEPLIQRFCLIVKQLSFYRYPIMFA